MDKIITYLKELNLSDIEARLYLTLLRTGPTSVRDLAETMDMKRTTAYFYIDQLVDKSLILRLVRGSKKLIAASEPKSLETLVTQKLETAKLAQKEFPAILSTLTASLPVPVENGEADIKYYKGKNGVKKIYEEALKANELRSYFNFELIKEALPDNEVLFVDALRKNKDIIIYELLQDTPLSRNIVNASRTISLNADRYKYKFMPEGILLSAADILIYDGHVGIVNVRNQYTGIVLKNTDFFNNTKEFFDLIWKSLPEADQN